VVIGVFCFLSEGGAAWDLTKVTVLKNDVVQNFRRADLLRDLRRRGRGAALSRRTEAGA
jgi:hypothetical protein